MTVHPKRTNLWKRTLNGGAVGVAGETMAATAARNGEFNISLPNVGGCPSPVCATFVHQAITPGGEFNNENTTTGQAILKSPLSKSASILPLSFA